MRTLDYVDVLRDLVIIVAEDPDRTVEESVYFNDDGTPSCLVGHWLAKQGVGESSIDNEASWPWIDTEPFGFYLTAKASDLLSLAQAYQDRPHKWSTALRMAVQDVSP